MKVVRLSASRTGRLYPQKISWYSFSLGTESNTYIYVHINTYMHTQHAKTHTHTNGES